MNELYDIEKIKTDLKSKFGVDWRPNYDRTGLLFVPFEQKVFQSPRLVYYLATKEIFIADLAISMKNQPVLSDSEVRSFIKIHTKLKNFQ